MINDFHLVLSLQKLNHSHVENNGLQRNEIHEGDLLDSDTILLVDPAGKLNKKMLNCF